MRLLFVLSILFNICIINAQNLFYQNTFKGGVCGDGKSYVDNSSYNVNDTIRFQNIIPSGSVVKKAFLITHKSNTYVGVFPNKDFRFNVNFNGNNIIIDSTSEATPFFNCYNTTTAFQKICVTDVTNLTLNSNNILIRPSQPIVNLDYNYTSMYLIILYEDLTLSTCNAAIYLNNQTYYPTLTNSLNGLNKINTIKDVGLSIWTEMTSIDYPLTFTLNSSLGSFSLGTILEAFTAGIPSEKSAGSFDYNNGNLYGLSDDTPNAYIDSTDALANIKNYLPNNTQNFTLTSNTINNYLCSGAINSFFLAYTTPCPARGFNDTIAKHTICQGQSISLNTQSTGNSYSWYPTTGLTNANSATPIASPTTTTNYIVSIDSAGCKHTEQVQVAVTPIPQADTIFASNNVCGGPSGSIIVKPGHGPYEPYTYSLNNAAGVSDTSFTNLNGGNYNVLITDTTGCTWQSNVITINNTIGVNASFNTQTVSSSAIAPLFVSFINSTSGATNYNWYFPTTTSNTYNSNYTFTEAGTYTVTLIAYNNLQQCADTATKIIVVLPQDTAGIFIPNVFSPNGDGVNDVFEIKIKNAQLEVFEMYDRWGVLVSSALDLTKSNIGNITHFAWTGRTTSGIECSAGTYFYVIKVKLDSAYSKEGTKEFKGFVTLVR